jgi:hypothetical protein
VSKYLAVLKGQYFSMSAPRVLQKVQKDPSYSFCSTQVPSTRKYQGDETAANDCPGTPDPRAATPAEAAELRALVTLIYANPDDRAEPLAAALADPDAALICYRALAADRNAVALFVESPPLVPDDQRTCRQCRNLAASGRCLAAARGELPYVAGRKYSPVPDVPKRCEGFRDRSAQ